MARARRCWSSPGPAWSLSPVAWLLRRFSRGYDEAVVAEGRILLLPRVPAPHIGRVRARLARVLAGQCSVSVVETSSARQRFDATG